MKPTSQPPVILSVDDSAMVRKMVARAFRPFDCVLLTAANGEEGLALAESENPDLILLDITMPVMDGITMLHRLRGEAATRKIPVIMLTAESSRDTVAHMAKLGVRDYVVKPFKEEELAGRVRRVIPLKKHDEAELRRPGTSEAARRGRKQRAP